MDKLAAMRVFVEIVERGSLSAAAAALDRAPPTIVRSLAQLESSLGVRLLHRTTRSMTLTAEGRAYHERCRRILADVAEADAALGAAQGPLAGAVRVTAPVLFGRRYVLGALTTVAAAHPALQVELLLLDRVVNLVEEGLDLGVRIGPLADAAMAVVPVGRMRRVTVASPACLARHGVPRTPEALAGRPAVLFRGLTSGSTWHFAGDGGGSQGVAVAAAFVCNQAEAAVEACAAGLGFGAFLAYQVEEAVLAGRLHIVLDRFEQPPLPVSLVLPTPRLLSPRVRCVLDALREHLRACSWLA
ncbi:MAG: LysR family transcriptional regulator [Gammaproteobacteria bacterium]